MRNGATPSVTESTSQGDTSVETPVPFDADSGLLGVHVRCPCPDPVRHAHRHRYRSPESDRARRRRRHHQRRHERVAGTGHQRRRSLHRAPAAGGHLLPHRDPVRLRAVQAIGHHPQRDRDRARACRVVGRGARPDHRSLCRVAAAADRPHQRVRSHRRRDDRGAAEHHPEPAGLRVSAARRRATRRSRGHHKPQFVRHRRGRTTPVVGGRRQRRARVHE